MSERDFADFIRILKRRRARFLVIGGYAMAHHGLVRATNDVDVLIATDDLNVTRVHAAAREFVGVEPSDRALRPATQAIYSAARASTVSLARFGSTERDRVDSSSNSVR
jgi:hypothetical protein